VQVGLTEGLRCDQCGSPLENDSTTTGCLNCLIAGGLDFADLENRRFQHYEVSLLDDGISSRELGRGAMGITYQAIDLNLGSVVALKVISDRHAEDAGVRERFRREARAAAQLRHPNIASVFHFGETETGQCFYAMEFVEGETLEQQVRRAGPLPTPAALELSIQVTSALMAAEKQGLVHRDLKPGNLMLATNHSDNTGALLVKVIDFGLAKAVAAPRPGRQGPEPSFSGTPAFASPEQFNQGEQSPDVRSDIYSLGVTLWYSLTGKTPFGADVPADIHDRQLNQPLPLAQLNHLKLPAAVLALLRSMLAPDPGQRPQTARELFHALQDCRQRLQPKSRQPRPVVILSAIAALLGMLALTSYFWRQHSGTDRAPEKSIAVLPFDNLSTDEQDAYFAAGIQDEILSHLAKVADLKVISRTSVMQYKSADARNLREIGRALGVAHVVQGSVQRIANRVRVNAQLIDARTDAHLWAETYDRELADVFDIQGEIAQRIAEQLRAKISPMEKASIVQPPTTDLTAYTLYTEAKALGAWAWADWHDWKQTRPRVLELLQEAIRRDPNFVLAYCSLAKAYGHSHVQAQFAGYETESIDKLWKQAIDNAIRLGPNTGQPHLALARYHLFLGNLRAAREEMVIARRLLPNDSEALFIAARIDRRQSRWHDSLANVRKAYELDPHNAEIIIWTSEHYRLIRRYTEGEQFARQAMESMPEITSSLYVQVAEFKLAEGNPRDAQDILARVPPKIGASTRFQAALYLRDYDMAEQVIAATPVDEVEAAFKGKPPHSLANGQLAKARGDNKTAQEAFLGARQDWEDPNAHRRRDEMYFSEISLLDAGLGRKEQAIREGEQAVALVPISEDALNGEELMYNLALVYTWTGERTLAIEKLKLLAEIPSEFSYGDLRFNPCWDSLRGDPRFEQIVGLLKPH
jgi:serine/threonine protein kinase/tetratricopeptide (TPR) repeat protein